MTAIGQVDHVLLLLRERLGRAERRRASGERTDRAGPLAARPLDRVRALATLDGMAEDELRRGVVRAVLADRFGEPVANDVAFQAIVDEVARTIVATPEGRALLTQAIAELRG